jgi:hypothetical protein
MVNTQISVNLCTIYVWLNGGSLARDSSCHGFLMARNLLSGIVFDVAAKHSHPNKQLRPPKIATDMAQVSLLLLQKSVSKEQKNTCTNRGKVNAVAHLHRGVSALYFHGCMCFTHSPSLPLPVFTCSNLLESNVF